MDSISFVKRQHRDIDNVVKLGAQSARRSAIVLRQRILAAYQRGDPLRVRVALVDEMLDALVDAMTLLHLRGMTFTDSIASQSIALASKRKRKNRNERLVAMLEKLHNPKAVALLQEKYAAQALAILNTVGDSVETRLREFVTDLIGTGTPIKDGVKKLSTRFDELGITAKSGGQVETIYRTQSQLAYNAGRWEADSDPEIQAILWGYEYSTVGDNRVRPTHAALDGAKLPKDDPFWQRFWPPNGWNCRCTAIPIFQETQIKRPPTQTTEGETVAPDKGFNFNVGELVRIAA